MPIISYGWRHNNGRPAYWLSECNKLIKRCSHRDRSSLKTTRSDWVRRRHRDNCSTCSCQTDPGSTRQDTPDTWSWWKQCYLWCTSRSSPGNTALDTFNNTDGREPISQKQQTYIACDGDVEVFTVDCVCTSLTAFVTSQQCFTMQMYENGDSYHRENFRIDGIISGIMLFNSPDGSTLCNWVLGDICCDWHHLFYIWLGFDAFNNTALSISGSTLLQYFERLKWAYIFVFFLFLLSKR